MEISSAQRSVVRTWQELVRLGAWRSPRRGMRSLPHLRPALIECRYTLDCEEGERLALGDVT